MSQNDLRKYFNRTTPSGAIILVVLGGLVLLTGNLDEGLKRTIIGISILICGSSLLITYSIRCSDRSVDSFCECLVNKYYLHTKNILAIKNVRIIDSICSSGYCFDNIFTARKALRGKDNIFRSSILEISCVYFTEQTVHLFNLKQSLVTDEQCEKQVEFRRDDIQMVSLEEINYHSIVTLVIPGNEKIHIKCQNREEAIRLCDSFKNGNC